MTASPAVWILVAVLVSVLLAAAGIAVWILATEDAPTKAQAQAPAQTPAPNTNAAGGGGGGARGVALSSRYYFGTAFEPLASYLASSPPAWTAIRDKVGFWNHPMGVAAAEVAGNAQAYVAAFGVRQMLLEANLIGSAVENPVLVKNPAAPGEKAIRHSGNIPLSCVGYLPFSESDAMSNDPEEVLRKYKLTFAAFDGGKIPTNNFIFWSPASQPDYISNLMAPYKGCSSIPDYLLQQTGAAGQAIDFPWRYMLHGSQEQQTKLMRAAVQLFQETKKRNGLFVWVLDGGGKAEDVLSAVREVLSNNIRPDAWVIDQFNPISEPGFAHFYGPEEAVKQMAMLVSAGV